MTRLDKYLCDSGILTRSEASRAVRSGRVAVNGVQLRDPSAKIDEKTASVTLDSKEIGWKKYRYIMLNKPTDTVSTTEDDPKSVMKLLPPEFSRMDMFPCGRLDIDTTGLLIITNDGQTAHNLLSPKKHCEKTYRFTCIPIDEKQKTELESGVELIRLHLKTVQHQPFFPLVRRDNGNGGQIPPDKAYVPLRRLRDTHA